MYNTVDPGIQGIIASKAHMQPGFEYRAALSHQDTSRRHKLAPEALDTQPLTDTIPSISRAASCLLMRHGAFSLYALGLITRRTSDDLIDAEECLRLTMTLLLLVALASLVLIDQNLGAALLSNDGAYDASLLELWLSDNDLVPFSDHQHGCNLNSIPCGTLKFLDRYQVPL
jgi:hypothetical protein